MYSRLIILTIFVVLSSLNASSQMPGALDPTYSDQGLKVLQLGTANALAVSMVMQNDDKAIVAGIAGNGNDNDFVIVRMTPEGDLDETFGDEGIVFTDFDSSTDIAQSVELDHLNRIVVGGYIDNGNGFDFGVARYLHDGSLDTDFGGGLVTTSLGATAFCRSVAVQSDNKIVAAGYVLNPQTATNEFVITRYTEEGQPDSTFHHDGIATTNFGIGTAVAFAMTIQHDGKLVVAGQVFNEAEFRWEIGIARYLPDGSLDETWSEDGMLTTPTPQVNHTINAIAIDLEKRILVGGYQGTAPSNNVFTLARYLTDGTLDHSFSEDGMASHSFGAEDSQINALVVQPDGKILAGGSTLTGNSNMFAIARFVEDGNFDDSFGENGIVLTVIGQNDGIEAMTLQGDGKLVASGESFFINRFSMVVARYETGLSTAIRNDTDPFHLSVYPNPVHDRLNIFVPDPKNQIVQISILNNAGQVVFRENIVNNLIDINTSSWAAGAYYAHVRTKNGTEIAKVILTVH